jgi:hypothetical protein
MKTHYSILLFCTTLFFNKCFSQNKISGNEIYSDSSGGYIELFGMGASADRTPFWMHANQFGIVPKTGSTGSARLGLEKFWNLQPEGKGHFRAGIGVEVVGNLGETQQFILPQAYGSLRFKNWELYVGRKKAVRRSCRFNARNRIIRLVRECFANPKNSDWTTRFVPIPFTNGWLSFNAFYSDGVFEKVASLQVALNFTKRRFI